MALPSTPVKFRLFNADGTSAVGLHVSAKLTRADSDAGAVVPDRVIRGVSGVSGECTLSLWPNARGSSGSQYAVTITRNGILAEEYTITVPESVGVVLAESIRSAAPYPPVSAAQLALEGAQQAVIDAANASRLTAGTVTVGPLAATITGEPGAQVVNFVIPVSEGGGGGVTNLGYTASPTGGTVTSDTGTDATIPAADDTNAGLFLPAEKSKLAGLPETADAAGTAAAAVSDLAATLGGAAGLDVGTTAGTVAAGDDARLSDARPPTAHGHAVGEITGLDTDTVPEGATNLYHTAARVRSTVLTGLSLAAGTVVNATHTVLEALGFLQKQVSDHTSSTSNPHSTTAAQVGAIPTGGLKTINGNGLEGSGDIAVSAAPAGASGVVQFNNAGAFGGTSGMTWDSGNNRLNIAPGGFGRTVGAGQYNAEVQFRLENDNGASVRTFGIFYEGGIYTQFRNDGGTHGALSSNGFTVARGSDGAGFGFGPATTTADTFLKSDAIGNLDLRQNTWQTQIAMGFRVWEKNISSTNYSRVALQSVIDGAFQIATEAAGATARKNLTLSAPQVSIDGLLMPKQYTTATRPSWINGAVIFDSDLDKIVIGGASGWEVVTST